MTRIVFTRRLDAPIEIAWDMLTDPERMNAWSVAPVSSSAGTDPSVPGGERIVHVRRFGIRLKLREVTVVADRPRRFRYRVRPNVIVRKHVAEQRMQPQGNFTLLEWEVDIRSWVPGLMPILVGAMRAQLEASLDQLEVVARESSGSAT